MLTSVENWSKFVVFFYLGFLPRPFTNHRTAREGGGHFFNSSLPLPPASQTLRHWAGRLLHRTYIYTQLAAGLEPGTLVSECKSLTTKLRAQVNTKYIFRLSRSYRSPKQNFTAQKMKFSSKDFFSKCDQIRQKLRIWSHLLKMFLMENVIFCAVLHAI